MKKAVIVSGYFNPLHKGHLEYFKLAKDKGDLLFIIVNNDFQRSLKKAKEFMLEDERCFIINELRIVDKTILSIDNDRTVCRTIKKIFTDFSSEFHFCFANGGDQNNDSSPEAPICKKLGIELIDGLGDKIQSSSWLLNKN